MNFIDLFAGIGGFHQGALNAKGFECAFASEIDDDLRDLYLENYGLYPKGDITKIMARDIPPHDIICAGFPCQPFSLAGQKQGTKCPESGKLINDILRIMECHSPRFVILENVPNILTIEDGAFWNYIKQHFAQMGYCLRHQVFSPVDFGIPQNRKRLFVLAFRNSSDLEAFRWPEKTQIQETALSDLLDHRLEHKLLEPIKRKQLEHWQRLLNHLKVKGVALTRILAPEFGATYPYNLNDYKLSELQKFKGAYGADLHSCKSFHEIIQALPHYVRKNAQLPQRIHGYVQKTRLLYDAYKDFADDWAFNLNKQNNSWQILEWHGLKGSFDLSKHMIQFRPSGIRISKANIAPSLVAMTPTQIPIIGKDMRYMSKYEAARLQHIDTLKKLPAGNTKAFKALGNAINAKIIELIFKQIQVII